MKIMGPLFGYEMKKIWGRKLTWVVTATLVIICVVDAIAPMFLNGGYEFTYTAEDGTEYSIYLTSAEQAAVLKQGADNISGRVLDEEFFREMRRSLSAFRDDDPGLIGYLYLVDPTYAEPKAIINNVGLGLDTVTEEGFYAARRELARASWREQELSDMEMAYWEKQGSRIEEPFTYEYTHGLTWAIGKFRDLSTLLPLAVAIGLCGVFTEERRAKMEALIFSAKESRLPLCLSKALAGAVSTALIAAAMTVGTTVACLIAFGGWGFGAALQLYLLTSNLPIKVGCVFLMFLGLLVVYGLLYAALTMLVSALMRSTNAALTVSFLPILGLIYLQGWVRPEGRAADYLPFNLFATGSLENGRLTELAGIQLNIFQSGFLLYLVLTAILLLLCALVWRWNATRGS